MRKCRSQRATCVRDVVGAAAARLKIAMAAGNAAIIARRFMHRPRASAAALLPSFLRGQACRREIGSRPATAPGVHLAAVAILMLQLLHLCVIHRRRRQQLAQRSQTRRAPSADAPARHFPRRDDGDALIVAYAGLALHLD